VIDISRAIVPKSDQLNADDLIGGPRTITVVSVMMIAEDVADGRPVAIHFDGCNGKPYKPCKSMLRVLLRAWGKDASKYTGRSITLYLDEAIRFGGAAVGGIRISHLSHIAGPITMALTVTRGTKKAYTVRPLDVASLPDHPPAEADPVLISAGLAASSEGVEIYTQWLGGLTPDQKEQIRNMHQEWSKRAKLADMDMDKGQDQ
jgi:hypothetical protein